MKIKFDFCRKIFTPLNLKAKKLLTMKKIVFSVLFLFANLYFAAAQSTADDSSDELRFGFQASPSWSWMTSTNSSINGSGANWGLKLGVVVEKYFRTKFAITTGLGFGFNQGGTLQYDNKGYYWAALDNPIFSPDTATATPFLGNGAKLTHHLTFIEVPIGLKMRGSLGEDNPVKFFAEAPIFTLGFMTKAKGDVRDTDYEGENIRKLMKGFNLAWGFGLGAQYELAGGTELVGGFYFQKYFLDANKNGAKYIDSKNNEISENSKMNIGSLTMRVAVLF